jgi:hypothetical protein
VSAGPQMVECATCFAWFNNTAETAGVCPNGHTNSWTDDPEDVENERHLRKLTW